MNESVFCWNCDKSFEIDADEYYETEQENTFKVVRCPHCKKPNSITWSNMVHFSSHEPDESDLKDYGYELEDEDE